MNNELMSIVFFILLFVMLQGGLWVFYYLPLKLRWQQSTQAVAQSQEQQSKLLQEKRILMEEKAVLAAEKKAYAAQLAEWKAKDLLPKEEILAHFQNAAQLFLEKKKEDLSIQNNQQLQSLLLPLKERITHFEQRIHKSQQEAFDRNTALRTQLKDMMQLHHRMMTQAENLTQAIKGDRVVQGQWGEFVLERILEQSGLRKGEEYLLQNQITTASGERYRPDVIIQLPDNKSIVIDAKVSLSDYERFYHATDQKEQTQHLKKHIRALRAHLKLLTEKKYSFQESVTGLDFVLMFLPIEPAFMLAIQHDPLLFEEAHRKNIILVGPSTLMATLRTVAHTWRVQHQQLHAQQIMRQSGMLYDKFVGFLESHQKVGHALSHAQKAYEQSGKKLYMGQGNLIGRIEKLKEWGSYTQKEMPPLPTS